MYVDCTNTVSDHNKKINIILLFYNGMILLINLEQCNYNIIPGSYLNTTVDVFISRFNAITSTVTVINTSLSQSHVIEYVFSTFYIQSHS